MPDALRVSFVFPFQELAASFLFMSKVSQDLRKPYAEGADDLADDLEKQFSKEGSGRSGGWEELSWMSEEIRSQEGYSPSHPILEQEGDLRRSFTQDRARGHVREITKTSLVMGSDLKVYHGGKSWVLAAIHQEDHEILVTAKMASWFWQTETKSWRINLWGMWQRGDSLTYPGRVIMYVSPAALKRMMIRVQMYVLDNFRQTFRGFATIHVGGADA